MLSNLSSNICNKQDVWNFTFLHNLEIYFCDLAFLGISVMAYFRHMNKVTNFPEQQPIKYQGQTRGNFYFFVTIFLLPRIQFLIHLWW